MRSGSVRTRAIVIGAGLLLAAFLGQRALALTRCLDNVVHSQACWFDQSLNRPCCVWNFLNEQKRVCTVDQYLGFPFAAAFWTNRVDCQEPTATCMPNTNNCPP
jgi:hypothetical protein